MKNFNDCIAVITIALGILYIYLISADYAKSKKPLDYKTFAM